MPSTPDTSAPEPLKPTQFTLSFEQPPFLGGVQLEAIPAQITGVAVQLTRLVVHDTRPRLLGRNEADIYPVFLLVSGPSDDPVTWNAQHAYNDVMPSEPVPIARTAPPTIYRSLGQLPSYMDLHILVMRSHQRGRDTGAAIQQVMGSADGKAALAAIRMAVAAANLGAGMAVGVGTRLLNLLGAALSERRDRQLFYAVASFERTADLGMGLVHTLKTNGAEVDIEVFGLRGGATPP